jgi:PEP-CTERM motif
MLTRYSRTILASTGLIVLFAAAPAMADPDFAVWLDGNTTPGGGGNGIVTSLDNAFGVGDYTLVTTSQLETPGFLDAFKTVVVSRYDSSFGSSLSAAAASNIATYVGTGATEGGVAVFTNDAADNFFGATTGDVYDANLNQLFVNAATYASASGHGYIGEFNGAVMAMSSNSAGMPAIGLLQGSANGVHGFGPQFLYGVGPIGSGNPIDAGVTFPFTDGDTSTFLTDITGADPNNIVDVYTSEGIDGEPAVLADHFVISGGGGGTPAVPEPSTWAMMLLGFAGLGMAGRRAARKRVAAASLA